MTRVSISHGDGVTLLCFAEPILSIALLRDLESTLCELAQEPAGLPLVLTSAHERIFLAGANLREISALDAETSRPYARRGRRILDRLARMPVPTVAAVHGACAGGGLDLALSCDLVAAAEDADLSHPGVRRGLVTGWGGTLLVPAMVGRSAARRSLLQGSPLAAHEPRQREANPAPRRDVIAAAIRMARQLADLHPLRLAMWRGLRHGHFVDRFRTFVVHNEL